MAGTIGCNGWFYHFLDMNTGLRAWNCELSSIDTGLLLAGILYAREYFDGRLLDHAPGAVQQNDGIITLSWDDFRRSSNFTALYVA